MSRLPPADPLDFCITRSVAQCISASLSLALVLALPLHAAPASIRAASAGGPNNDKTRGVTVDTESRVLFVGEATDRAGNCYVTGHHQSTDADFSGTKPANRGGNDLCGAKLSAV